METGISAPWVVLYRELEAFFELDDEVAVVYDEDETVIRLMVDNPLKADALSQILKAEHEFGNVTVNVSVIPCNEEISEEQLLRTALDGNPVLSDVCGVTWPDGAKLTYALFEPDVIQFFADNLRSPFGFVTKTVEQVAEDVLCLDEIVISSDSRDCDEF